MQLPGVIGGTGNNPAVRLIKYDKTTGKTLDYEQFFLNLKAANEKNQSNWVSLYNFTKVYNLPSADHQQMGQLSRKLRSNKSLFDNYYKLNGVMYDPKETCSGLCKSVQLCAIENVIYDDYKKCIDNEKSLSNYLVSSTYTLLISILFLYFL